MAKYRFEAVVVIETDNPRQDDAFQIMENVIAEYPYSDLWSGVRFTVKEVSNANE